MLIKKIIPAKTIQTKQYKQEQFIYHFKKNTMFYTAKNVQLNSLESSIAEEAVESCEH